MDNATVWITIAGLGLGSFALRFVFMGIIGDRPLPPWLLRHLRYTAVAVLPGLVAPLVLWPAATGGQPDLPRLAAAFSALGVGLVTRNVIFAVLSGAGVLFLGLYLQG
ncbi:AzlD domain-containing protein [Roseovarius sp. SYSU LYC5161]|uniref:AzlD domain-containing protein n=1 Tax=Roseovarius halophilus (ex Wu et al. 2025) TaxID=3376060 RepID=UPI003999C65D